MIQKAAAPLAFGSRALLLAHDLPVALTMMRRAAISVAAANPVARVILALPAAMPEDAAAFAAELAAVPAGASPDSPDSGESANDADSPSGIPMLCSADYDDAPDKTARLVSMLVDVSRRLVESGRDVIVFLHDLPQFLNLPAAEIGAVGRRGTPVAPLEETLLGLRRLFAAARSVPDGGSLTVVAGMQVAEDGACATAQRAALLNAFQGAANAVLALRSDGMPDAARSFSQFSPKA